MLIRLPNWRVDFEFSVIPGITNRFTGREFYNQGWECQRCNYLFPFDDLKWPINDTCVCGAKAIKVRLQPSSQQAANQQRQQAASQFSAFQQQINAQYQRAKATPFNPTGAPKPMTQSNARIWWDTSISAYRMTVPYNPTFNEMFKTLIAASDRSWDPQSKVWTITEQYFEPVRKLIEKTFGSAAVITRSASEKASQPPPVKTAPIDQVFLQFVKLLSYEAARKAYLIASQTLHPDRGGDMTKMADLNACWQRLEAEWFKKNSA